MAYVQNTNSLAEGRLKVTYGAKYLNVDAKFHSNGNTLNAPSYGDPDRPDFNVTAKGNFLPQAGAVFSLNKHEELFTNYSENINQYPLSPQEGIYNLNPVTFASFKTNVKPERASSVDFGIRTKRGAVEASLSSYYIGYRNRLVAAAQCQLTAFCASAYANVGTVTSKGLEGLLVWQLTPQVSWSSSGSYNSSIINDDYTTQSTRVRPSSQRRARALSTRRACWPTRASATRTRTGPATSACATSTSGISRFSTRFRCRPIRPPMPASAIAFPSRSRQGHERCSSTSTTSSMLRTSGRSARVASR